MYVAAVTLGSGRLPYRTALGRIHDSLAWLGQVAMFLMLGLLVYPSQLLDAAWIGTIVGLALAFVARPVMAALCLMPLRFPWNDILYVGWVGLRGAVPIILAMFPVLAGAPGAQRIFNIVFFIVVLNAILPGTTVSAVTRWLGLESDEPPPPNAVLTVESFDQLDGELLSYYIDEALPVAGMTLEELPFPEGAAVTMIVRGQQLIAPNGATRLEVGDHAYVLSRPEGVGNAAAAVRPAGEHLSRLEAGAKPARRPLRNAVYNVGAPSRARKERTNGCHHSGRGAFRRADRGGWRPSLLGDPVLHTSGRPDPPDAESQAHRARGRAGVRHPWPSHRRPTGTPRERRAGVP